MTQTPASQRETPVAVLFGSARRPAAAAAKRTLSPYLRANLGVLARLPETVRAAAAGAVIGAAVTLLDFNMIDLLVDGWREHRDLTTAARHTLARPGTELVALATHRITVTQRPSVDILINGERVTTVELELTLEFDISAAVAGVSGGMLAALHSGRCDVTAALVVAGTEAVRKHKRIELPGVISLGQGIRLLPEQDYLPASQLPPVAAEQYPAASVSMTETVQLAAVSSEEEATATQPAITPLPWRSRHPSPPG